MDIITKVRVLWEKLAGLETKEEATAATLEGILPRIPKDYSTNETPTGQKWIDGKDIYFKVIFGNFSEIETTTNVIIDDSFSNYLVEARLNLVTNGGTSYINRNPIIVDSSKILLSQVTSAFSLGSYVAIIYYTKPDPVPAQADNETRKRKTTKKEDK